MQLVGHSGEILACRFDPSGRTMASASFDRSIFFWNTYGGCENIAFIPNAHKNALLDLAWHPTSTALFSASADHTAAAWDVATCTRIRHYRGGHLSHVNAIAIHPEARGDHQQALLATVSDDGCVVLWDTRDKHPITSWSHSYQLTSVAWSYQHSMQLLVGSLDGTLSLLDVRHVDGEDKALSQEAVMTLSGHTDMITSVKTHASIPDKAYSFAADDTVRVWDMRPFVPGGETSRCTSVLTGARCHGVEKNLVRMAVESGGKRVAVGGVDRTVTIWDVPETGGAGRVVYKLPGHKGCVNDVDFHPKEPIVVSASTDRTLFLGEIAANG